MILDPKISLHIFFGFINHLISPIIVFFVCKSVLFFLVVVKLGRSESCARDILLNLKLCYYMNYNISVIKCYESLNNFKIHKYDTNAILLIEI